MSLGEVLYLVEPKKIYFKDLHYPTTESDHSIIELEFKIKPHFKKGTGYWKCNTNTLNHNDFTADMENLCREVNLAEIKDVKWWESCKQRFRRLIILHSCRLYDNTKRRIEAIENELREAQDFEFRNPGSNLEQIAVVENDSLNVWMKSARAQKLG